MSENNDKRVAVLIDAENIAAKNIDEILDKASLEGRATVKRIYGDFSAESKSGQARGWNKIVSEYALAQVQQIQNTIGKNSSDSALIIDAMDLLFSGTIDVMCLVTNDSDFTRLAMRIADSGLEVIGMGTSERDTSKSFVNACTKFYYLDENKASRVKTAGEAKKQGSTAAEKGKKTVATNAKAQPVPKRVIDAIATAIENEDTDAEGWANIAPIGSVLYRRFPEFDPTLWNRPKQLSQFLASLDEFEVAQGEALGRGGGSYIRIRS